MHAKPTDCRTWYVVFDSPRTRLRWWHLLTGRLFSHCWAFCAAGDDMIVRVDPQAWGVHVAPMAHNVDAILLEMAQRPITALLSVTVDYKIASCHEPMRGLYNCVSQLKAMLGVRGPLILTPFQLYKRLCKHEGCIPIKAYIPHIRL